MLYQQPRFLPGGDRALFVEFGDSIDPDINCRVHSLAQAIETARLNGVVETVPTYRSLLVYYDPLVMSMEELKQKLAQLVQLQADSVVSKSRVIEIPTVYGGEFGPDLEFVAQHNNLSLEEVIKTHTAIPYLIYMIGFLPGFPYLGGMSPKIAAPRMDTPRMKISAGSVGIAGSQTGIYPIESPGGWRLIGRTPLRILDVQREPPALFQAGDYLRFVSISADEFKVILEEVGRGEYKVKIRNTNIEIRNNVQNTNIK